MFKGKRTKVYISFLEELSPGIYTARGIIAEPGVTDIQKILDDRVFCKMYIHTTQAEMMAQIAKWNNGLSACQAGTVPYGERIVLTAPVVDRWKDHVMDWWAPRDPELHDAVSEAAAAYKM